MMHTGHLVAGQAEDPPRGAHVPDRQRLDGRAEPDGTAREQQVLHRRVDRPVQRRHRDLGPTHRAVLQVASVAGDHEHRELLEVLGLPLARRHVAHRLGVAAGLAFDDRAEHPVQPPVELGQAGLLLGVLDDQVGPVLGVRARRRLERELEQRQQHVVVDRVEVQATHRALGAHRLVHRHAEPCERVGRGRWREGHLLRVVHVSSEISNRWPSGSRKNARVSPGRTCGAARNTAPRSRRSS